MVAGWWWIDIDSLQDNPRIVEIQKRRKKYWFGLVRKQSRYVFPLVFKNNILAEVYISEKKIALFPYPVILHFVRNIQRDG